MLRIFNANLSYFSATLNCDELRCGSIGRPQCDSIPRCKLVVVTIFSGPPVCVITTYSIVSPARHDRVWSSRRRDLVSKRKLLCPADVAGRRSVAPTLSSSNTHIHGGTEKVKGMSKR